MMRNFLIMLTSAVCVSTVAQAQAPSPNATLAKATVEEQVKAIFARMDANRDGLLTRAESAAARSKMMDARTSAMFNALDANRDGNISRAEFAAANQRAINQATGGKGIPDRDFDLADGNRDGRVTLDEALAQPRRQFDAADANKDGKLTLAERKAAATRAQRK